MQALWYKILQQDDRFLLIILAIVVGVCSSFAALALTFLIETLFHLYSYVKDYSFVFILPAIGAICSSCFLNNFLKEGAGHGVPEVIYSVSRYGGLLRLRSSFSRIISSSLTIGSGGSAGPEAPVVMSGAAIGSNIAKIAKLNDRQRICLVGCGTAGAIASIFNAPIAGLVFTMEVLLGKWRTTNVIPIAIAAVSGASLTHFISGNRVVFSHQIFTSNFTDILVSAGLGLVTAIVSVFFYFSLSKSYNFFSKKKAPLWFKAGIGGIIVGVMGLSFPDILGEGYHPIKIIINSGYNASFFIVFMVCILKIFATSFTLGSGGSGGIFAPCLVIGSFLGLAYYKFVMFFLPHLNITNEGYYALLGMAGILSGVLHAPLTGIFLILEITASYNVMLPLVVVSVMSTSLSHFIYPYSFYMKGLIDTKSLLREGTDLRVLSDMDIRELLEKDCVVINENITLNHFFKNEIKYSKRNLFPVEDDEGNFVGLLDFNDVRKYIFNPIVCNSTLVRYVMRPKKDVYKATIDDSLNEILFIMDNKGLFSVPILYNGRFIGMLSKATILDKYRTELLLQAD